MYYRLDWKVSPPDPSLSNTEACPNLGVPWTMGIKLNRALPEPIVCSLNPKRGPRLRDMYLIDIPLFSERFLKVLSDAGVENLETWHAEIRGVDGAVHTQYRAVNIVGLVQCADLTRSQYLPGTDPPLMEFSELVIDSARASEFDFFRLGESSLYIVISERMRAAIERAQLVGVQISPIETV